MSTLTERYLAATLRGIPERQRADVERELRSSITDAVEDRVEAGEERAAAEKGVLEGLGSPMTLAANYSGRPMYLIGPDMFLVYRHILFMLVGVVVPVVAVIQTAVGIGGGGEYLDALLGGLAAALNIGVQLAFWVTVVFVVLERAEFAREARSEIAGATSRWTVDMLPETTEDRVALGEVAGELFTTLLTIGGLFFLRDLAWENDTGVGMSVLNPDLSYFWVPALIILLAAIGLVWIVVYLVGRWTLWLASAFAVLEMGFALPVIALALNGELINPAFAAEIGWPPLAEGDGPVMLALAAGVLLVTAWEIFSAGRRALRARGRATEEVAA
jgi:hypothetical protein